MSRIIFSSSKDIRSSDVLKQAQWHPLSNCCELVQLKLMHKACHDELPQVLSDISKFLAQENDFPAS